MSEEGVDRRLPTILSADVVGYSRLMGKDEAGTLAALKAHRKELIVPKEAQYHGRTIKLMGDGVLMEFGSVVDAVHFAVEMQIAMQTRNAKVPEDRQIIYRIGINCSIDYLRRKKNKKEDFSDWDKWEKTVPSSNPDPEHATGIEQLRKMISHIVEELSPRQRMVFILKHYQQFSIKEIAEYLDCSEGSVKKQLFRAVSAIKKPLKKFLWEKDYGLQKI